MKKVDIANKLSELTEAGQKKYSYAYTSSLYESLLTELLVKMPHEQQQKYMDEWIAPLLKSVTSKLSFRPGVEDTSPGLSI